MPIRILPDQVASQIAAGEVVERPASVVKELVENAIDAGARTINIDIRGGGRRLVQVSDDGQGIPQAEMETAFRRHATSKLSTAADLNAVETLGFRGEALAAISAVSRVTAVSRTLQEEAGTRLMLEGGEIASRERVGAPYGTVIAVANLFYNVPARLKFLKSETTEKRHIDEIVTRYAMAYPHVRFRLTQDGRITFQTSGTDLLDVLNVIYGSETAKQLVKIEERDGSAEIETLEDEESTPRPARIRVGGYIAPPAINWSSRGQITLYVNGRWIKDNRLNYAVIQAYHTLLPVGRYPLAVVFISTAAENVDVNVHPMKTEVRFRHANAVFGALQRSVRKAILEGSPIPHATHFSPLPGGWSADTGTVGTDHYQGAYLSGELELQWGRERTPLTSPGQTEAVFPDYTEGQKLPIMRVVGQVRASYIITEGPDGLYLIDQHAAHERILYEKFMAAWQENPSEGGLASQGLVAGATVQLSPAQSTLLEEQLEFLDQIGFRIEPFGPNTFMVRSVPAILTKQEPQRALLDVVEDLERGDRPLQEKIEARIILRVCKTAAVKAGQTMSLHEMQEMVGQLEKCHNPHTCPHGRPTLIHLSAAQLAKEFGRT